MLPRADESWTLHEAAHLLNRAGFGGSPDEIRALHALGRRQAVESLVAPAESVDAIPPPAWAEKEQAVANMLRRAEDRRALMQENPGANPEELERKRREFGRRLQIESRRQALEGQGWWFRRMLTSGAPLREKMTLFWHDHFACSIQKVRSSELMMNQNRLFRQHALGNFRELTHQVLMDPAMMEYLDLRGSRKGSPNENFAREFFELFTLGEGNYTEQDVREAARAFTGYLMDRRTMHSFHSRRLWDETPKTILGKTGPFNGSDVIGLILDNPASARFIARKIWEFFVYERPSDAAITALAGVLIKADHGIAPLLREIFLSREFYAESSMRTQIKCPVQFLVQMLKQLEITTPPEAFPLIGQQQLGQSLFMPPNVAGWDWGQAWINTNTLLSRYNLAGFLTKGSEENGIRTERIRTPGMAPAPRAMDTGWTGPDYGKIAPRPLRENPPELVDSLVFRFFQGPVPDKARQSFVDYATAKKGVIFTDKETAELCHLMLSTPYYQLC